LVGAGQKNSEKSGESSLAPPYCDHPGSTEYIEIQCHPMIPNGTTGGPSG